MGQAERGELFAKITAVGFAGLMLWATAAQFWNDFVGHSAVQSAGPAVQGMVLLGLAGGLAAILLFSILDGKIL